VGGKVPQELGRSSAFLRALRQKFEIQFSPDERRVQRGPERPEIASKIIGSRGRRPTKKTIDSFRQVFLRVCHQLPAAEGDLVAAEAGNIPDPPVKLPLLPKRSPAHRQGPPRHQNPQAKVQDVAQGSICREIDPHPRLRKARSEQVADQQAGGKAAKTQEDQRAQDRRRAPLQQQGEPALRSPLSQPAPLPKNQIVRGQSQRAGAARAVRTAQGRAEGKAALRLAQHGGVLLPRLPGQFLRHGDAQARNPQDAAHRAPPLLHRQRNGHRRRHLRHGPAPRRLGPALRPAQLRRPKGSHH